MLLRLLLLLLLAPLAELVVLLWIADKTSWETAVVMIVAGVLLGAWLVRRSWRHAMRLMRDGVALEDRSRALPDTLFTLAAGALLVVPGVLSDLLAVALLIPWSRQRIKVRLFGRMQTRARAWSGSTANGDDRIIDVQLVQPKKRTERGERITED